MNKQSSELFKLLLETDSNGNKVFYDKSLSGLGDVDLSDFEGTITLSGVDLSYINFVNGKNCTFILDYCNIENCSFSNLKIVTLSDSHVEDSRFSNVEIENGNDTTIENSTLSDVNFVKGKGIKIGYSDIDHITFASSSDENFFNYTIEDFHIEQCNIKNCPDLNLSGVFSRKENSITGCMADVNFENRETHISPTISSPSDINERYYCVIRSFANISKDGNCIPSTRLVDKSAAAEYLRLMDHPFLKETDLASIPRLGINTQRDIYKDEDNNYYFAFSESLPIAKPIKSLYSESVVPNIESTSIRETANQINTSSLATNPKAKLIINTKTQDATVLIPIDTKMSPEELNKLLDDKFNKAESVYEICLDELSTAKENVEKRSVEIITDEEVDYSPDSAKLSELDDKGLQNLFEDIKVSLSLASAKYKNEPSEENAQCLEDISNLLDDTKEEIHRRGLEEDDSKHKDLAEIDMEM